MIDEPKNINQVFNPLKLILIMLNHIIGRNLNSVIVYIIFYLQSKTILSHFHVETG